jgi:adenosine deaminase
LPRFARTPHRQTQANYETHPAKKLLDMGLSVTLNTDNPVISGVTLESEYDVALEKAGFNYDDLILMNINSVNASFMPDEKKKKLLES